jgi:enoyl-CoA hydratase/carnithine racemase
MPAELLTSRHHATLILTLSGGSASSLLQANIHAALIESLAMAEADRSLAGVVLTGLEHFTPSEGKPGSASPLSDSALDHLSDWIDTLHAFPKPVIAATEGQVTGPGLSLMLACDLVVASRSSGFSAAPAMLGGTSWFLNRCMPHQLAMEILLEGRPIPADRLHALGLINRLAEEGNAIHSAIKWSDQIACETSRIEGIKALLQQAPHNSLSQQIAAETQSRMEN